jgi:hypothetical protein
LTEKTSHHSTLARLDRKLKKHTLSEECKSSINASRSADEELLQMPATA